MYDDWSIWGNPKMRDPSINALGEWEIKKLLVRGEAKIEDVGNLKGILTLKDGRWTMLVGGWESERWPTEDEAYGREDTTYSRSYETWDPMEWKQRFYGSSDKRQPRKEAFAATLFAVKAGQYTTGQGTLVKIPPDERLSGGTKLYSKELHFPAPERIFRTEISIERKDCLETAKKLVQEDGRKVAVLNMADGKCPGGSVVSGLSGGQEESLFRRSNYYLSLYRYADFGGQYGVKRSLFRRYPLDENFGGCFSPNVTVFRGTEEEGYPFLENPWKVSLIAVPSLKLSGRLEKHSGQTQIGDAQIPVVSNKIRTIFHIAIDNRIDTLVLSAFGCGDPFAPSRHVAELFAEILEEEPYRGRFRKIVFAIKDADYSNDNFEAFRDVFAIADVGKIKKKTEVSELRLQPGIRTIGDGMFRGFTGLKTMRLPEGIQQIGSGAFEGLTALESVELPDTLKTIGSEAFQDCTALQKIVFPASLEKIGDSAFSGCSGLRKLMLPDSVKSVGSYGFSDCTSLEEVKLPAALESVSVGLFAGCTSLRELTLPDTLEVINGHAFMNNKSLTGLTLPQGLRVIEKGAFWGCGALEKLSLPDTLETFGCDVFHGCGALGKIVLPSGLQKLNGQYERPMGRDRSFAANARWTAAGPDEGKADIVFGWKEEIPDCAFSGCSNLEHIALPDTLTAVGDFAFYGCKNIKEVDLPETIEKIGRKAFAETEISAIRFSGGLRELGSDLFEDCWSLKEIVFTGDCPVRDREPGDILADLGDFSRQLNAGFERIEHPLPESERICVIRYPADNPTWTAEKRERGPLEWGIKKEIRWEPSGKDK